MSRALTGERVVTPEGGFNPTWQRHVAAYALCGPALGPGRVVDVGCGIAGETCGIPVGMRIDTHHVILLWI